MKDFVLDLYRVYFDIPDYVLESSGTNEQVINKTRGIYVADGWYSCGIPDNIKYLGNLSTRHWSEARIPFKQAKR